MTDHTAKATASGIALTVLRGRPDAAELAAVTAVVTARLRAIEAARLHAERTARPAVAPRADWAVEDFGHRPTTTRPGP
ncbi:acyl-CoA carboxylase epsilon subunit [Streptomyces sp. CA-294286]|uniref:acyl-CoA carboxylase epsilon subunit n=1 Tax=Streptomyces sp. CA-294286 TaxID=3240070 RepID=UPI003D907BCF